MPIYEYQCVGCGEVFEIWQKVSDPPPTEHHCGGTDVRRVLSNTSFRLKGSGWYMTDYPRSGAPAEKAPGSSSDSQASEKAGAAEISTSKPASTDTSKVASASASGESGSASSGSSGAGTSSPSTDGGSSSSSSRSG